MNVLNEAILKKQHDAVVFTYTSSGPPHDLMWTAKWNQFQATGKTKKLAANECAKLIMQHIEPSIKPSISIPTQPNLQYEPQVDVYQSFGTVGVYLEPEPFVAFVAVNTKRVYVIYSRAWFETLLANSKKIIMFTHSAMDSFSEFTIDYRDVKRIPERRAHNTSLFECCKFSEFIAEVVTLLIE